MQAKEIVEALVKRKAKVENKTLSERLAEVEAKSTLEERLVAVKLDTLKDKLSNDALVDTLA